MKKNTIKIIGIFLVLAFVISIVSAEEMTVTQDYSWWNSFIHSINKFGLFTAEGQSRSCSVNADYTWTVQAGNSVTKTEILSKCGGDPSGLIDVYNSNWQYLDEYRIEIIGTGLNAGSSLKYFEIYCCPYAPCSSNSDCSNPPAVNYGDTCNVNYGSCYGTQPTHSTKVFKCISGNWVYQYSVSYGASTWCADSDDNNYLNSENTGSCLSSGPSWCSIQESTDVYLCLDGGWHLSTIAYPGEDYFCSNGGNNYVDLTGTEHCQSTAPSSSLCVSGSECAIESQSCGYSSSAPNCCAGLVCQNFQCVNPSSVVCGDNVCQSTETFTTCPEDCGNPPVCGNDLCELGETPGASYACPEDCTLAVQEGITINELKSFTTKDLAKSMCTQTSQCKEGTCLSLNYLEQEEYITSAQTESFFDDTSKLVFTSTGAIIGTSACVIVAGAVGISSAGAGFALFPLCALIGGAGGIAADQAYNGIMEAFASEDKESAGFCIVEDNTLGLGKYTEWAAFINITGNKGVDGAIIIVALILLIIIIK